MKRPRNNINSSERFNNDNKNAKISEPELNEPGKRKPPGILGRIPVQKAIRTSLSKDRHFIDQEMASEESNDEVFDDSVLKTSNDTVNILI
jgi:hypothetical protein